MANNETSVRRTFELDKENVENIEKLAWLKRLTFKEVVNNAFKEYFEDKTEILSQAEAKKSNRGRIPI